MPGASFAELSEPPPPWGWDGAYAKRGWTWSDDACPPKVARQCIPPDIDHPMGPVSPVPEPAPALLLALGLVAVYLWWRRARL